MHECFLMENFEQMHFSSIYFVFLAVLFFLFLWMHDSILTLNDLHMPRGIGRLNITRSVSYWVGLRNEKKNILFSVVHLKFEFCANSSEKGDELHDIALLFLDMLILFYHKIRVFNALVLCKLRKYGISITARSTVL